MHDCSILRLYVLIYELHAFYHAALIYAPPGVPPPDVCVFTQPFDRNSLDAFSARLVVAGRTVFLCKHSDYHGLRRPVPPKQRTAKGEKPEKQLILKPTGNAT